MSNFREKYEAYKRDMEWAEVWKTRTMVIFGILCIPLIIYRLRPPEQTETQLFFHFFEAYEEFFR